MKPTRVLIAIQARSTSERLPEKCFAKMGSKMMLEHVLTEVAKSALHLNHRFMQKNINVKVALLIPEGDPIERQFKLKNDIVFGSEKNVLQRYKKAADLYDADYIVRITGDCPMIPSSVISKHVTCAFMNRYDYISNAYDVRLAIDGNDCEVISRKLLDYVYENATSDYDKEHVTTYAKKHIPRWATYGVIAERQGLVQDIKLSVDTLEDLERVRKKIEFIEETEKKLEATFGKNHVHWY